MTPQEFTAALSGKRVHWRRTHLATNTIDDEAEMIVQASSDFLALRVKHGTWNVYDDRCLFSRSGNAFVAVVLTPFGNLLCDRFVICDNPIA